MRRLSLMSVLVLVVAACGEASDTEAGDGPSGRLADVGVSEVESGTHDGQVERQDVAVTVGDMSAERVEDAALEDITGEGPEDVELSPDTQGDASVLADSVESEQTDATQLDAELGDDGVDSASDSQADGAVDDDAASSTDALAPADIANADALADVLEAGEDVEDASEGVSDSSTPMDSDVDDASLGEDVDSQESSDTSTSDENSDAEDATLIDAVDAATPKPLYLLSVNNSQKTLEKIDVATGQGTDVCDLPPSSNYPSLTFSRDNILFASRQGQYLDAIDPCTCEVTPVGSYNGFTGVNGITSDFGLNLFGVSHIQDVLITINSQSGAGTSVGPLGVNFGYTGATWSDEEQVVYAIDASSDGLFKISPQTGEATFVAPLSLPMGTVGIEMHPENGVLYACSDAAHLLSVDLITGEVVDIGDMGQNTACNNLAAPWKEVPCLDGL